MSRVKKLNGSRINHSYAPLKVNHVRILLIQSNKRWKQVNERVETGCYTNRKEKAYGKIKLWLVDSGPTLWVPYTVAPIVEPPVTNL